MPTTTASTKHEVPALPYAFDALEPHIDATTMEIHHDRHHQTYVDKLNKALEGHDKLAGKPVVELISDLNAVPEEIRTAVRNNGGGHANHTLFWTILGPGGDSQPSQDLIDALNKKFGGVAKFQEEFTQAATSRFGSGWAWLCVGDNGGLRVCSTPNQDSPLMKGFVDCPGTPILGCDVWEHAYYLKYQNKRPDYVKAFWNVVDWAAVSDRYAAAKA